MNVKKNETRINKMRVSVRLNEDSSYSKLFGESKCQNIKLDNACKFYPNVSVPVFTNLWCRNVCSQSRLVHVISLYFV